MSLRERFRSDADVTGVQPANLPSLSADSHFLSYFSFSIFLSFHLTSSPSGMTDLDKNSEARLRREAERLRVMAIAGITLNASPSHSLSGVGMSIVAAFVCVLAVPLIYNYVQHVQSLLQNEVNYCKVSNRIRPVIPTIIFL